MSDPRYIYLGTCSIHGGVMTPGYTSTAPPMCPIDNLNTYDNPIPFQKRPKTNYDFSYNNIHISSSNLYQSVGYLRWPGNNSIGFVDNTSIIAFVSQGATGSLKIFDITNNVDILEFNDINNSIPSIYNIGVPNNLSDNEAVWEIQLKVTNLGSISLNCIMIN